MTNAITEERDVRKVLLCCFLLVLADDLQIRADGWRESEDERVTKEGTPPGTTKSQAVTSR